MSSCLRFDQTTSDWAIFAPSKARRPHEFRNRAGAARRVARLDERLTKGVADTLPLKHVPPKFAYR